MSLVVWAQSGGWDGPQPLTLLLVFACALCALWVLTLNGDDDG